MVVLLALVVVSMTGCATIFSKSNQGVSFDSTPAGADIKINGVVYGHTPATIPLEKNKSYVVEIAKEGYHPQLVTIQNKLGVGWVVLDAFSGALPLVVDAITGDWKTLSPKNVFVDLASK